MSQIEREDLAYFKRIGKRLSLTPKKLSLSKWKINNSMVASDFAQDMNAFCKLNPERNFPKRRKLSKLM
jgi:hypothetical protein